VEFQAVADMKVAASQAELMLELLERNATAPALGEWQQPGEELASLAASVLEQTGKGASGDPRASPLGDAASFAQAELEEHRAEDRKAGSGEGGETPSGKAGGLKLPQAK